VPDVARRSSVLKANKANKDVRVSLHLKVRFARWRFGGFDCDRSALSGKLTPPN